MVSKPLAKKTAQGKKQVILHKIHATKPRQAWGFFLCATSLFGKNGAKNQRKIVMKRLVFCLLATSGMAMAQPSPMKISDAEAAMKARQAIRDIEDGYKQLGSAGNDAAKLNHLVQHLVKKAAWPMNHLAYRALFPYHACPQALNDLASMARAKADKSAHLLSYYTKRFSESRPGCQRAVRKPDMSLKNIQ